jgi:hypothetical protein
MGNILKRLWYPTKMDVIGARRFYGFLCPFIVVIIVFFPSFVVVAGILIIAAFAIRAVIVVRAASTLPVDGDVMAKYRSVTYRKRVFHKYLSLFLPLASLVTLAVIPKYFYICFGSMAFFALASMSYADLTTWLFVTLSSLYVIASVILSWIQAGFSTVLVCLIIANFIYPEVLAAFLELNKLAASGRTANQSLQTDGANSSVSFPD